MSDTLDKLVKEAWRQACENGRSEAVRLMRREESPAVVKSEYGTVRQ